jgi:vitamin B12 transporter
MGIKTFKMKKEKRTLILLLTFLLGGAAAKAQDTLAQDSIQKLKEITVTGTRSEKNIFDIGRSITVLTADDLKKGHYNNLADVLWQQEGIYMVGTGQNFGGTQSLFMRGSNSNQSVILIDGVRITDPSAVNNSSDFSEFSLANVEKIEIVRGSHSTMYGSSAIGGVVNVITRKNDGPGFHADALAMGGMYGKGAVVNGQDLFLDYGLRNGFYVNGELNNFSSSGQDATVDTVTDPSVFKNRDKDGFSKHEFFGKAGYHNKSVDAYVGYRKTKMLSDIDKGAFRDDDNYTLDFSRGLVTYGASYKCTDSLTFSFLGGFSDMERISLDDSSVVDTAGTYDGTRFESTFRGTHSTSELQVDWRAKGMELVAGGGMYTETMSQFSHYYSRSSFGIYETRLDLDSVYPDGLMARTYDFFTHLDLNGSLISDRISAFSLGLGARFNSHSTFGNHITYEATPALHIGKGGLLYASWSTGFNAPSLYQLYAPDTYYTDTTITRGNTGLRPETASSYELGFKQKVNAQTSFSLSVFAAETKDAIEYVYLWDKHIGIDTLGNDWMRDDYRGDTYVNVGTLFTNGVEASVDSKLSEKFRIGACVSLVSGKLEYNSGGIDTSHTHGNHVQVYSSGIFLKSKDTEVLGLTRRPSTAHVSFTWMPLRPLMVRADVHYVGARPDVYYESGLGPFGALGTVPVGDYTLLDLTVKYNFTKNIGATVKAENLLDKKYYEINGFTTRGRGVYISLRASF